MRFSTSLAGALLVASTSHALDLDPDNADSIINASKQVAAGLMANYTGNDTGMIPGLFCQTGGQNCSFFGSGAIWDAMLDYQFLTGDTQYNDLISQGLSWQAGDGHDFMPANQTNTEANDDQSTWALAVMTAAEYNFTAPPSGTPAWIDMAQTVFQKQTERWDDKACTGGLRWQILPFNNGYNFMDATTNGQFMQLAARLFAQTKNATYSDWAEKIYSAATANGLVTDNGTVFAGAQIDGGCKDISHVEFSNNLGAWLYGAAVMANASSSSNTDNTSSKLGLLSWVARVASLVKGASKFSKSNVLSEPACAGKCNSDQHFDIGMFARDLGKTALKNPIAQKVILSVLKSSAKNVVKMGCEDPLQCVSDWLSEGGDQLSDPGSQMSALQTIQQNLQDGIKAINGTGTTPGSPSGTGSGPAKPSGAAGGAKATSATVMVLMLAGLCAFGLV